MKQKDQRRVLGFSVLVILCSIFIVPSTGQTECEADHQCLTQQFCYKTGYCTSCFNCQERYRRNEGVRDCAKDYSDCGSCMQGYREESLNGNEKRHSCIPATPSTAKPNMPTNNPEDDKKFLWAYIVGGAIAILVLLAASTYGYRRFKRSRTNVTDPRPDVLYNRDPPPAYTGCDKEDEAILIANERLVSSPLLSARPPCTPLPSAPLHPPPRWADSVPQPIHLGSEMVWIDISERADDNGQKAVPYLPPQGTYANSDEEATSENDDPIVGNHTPSIPDLDDEETMPSNWRPGDERLADENDNTVEANDSGTSSTMSLEGIGSTAQGTVPDYHRNFSAVSAAVVGNNRRRNHPSPEPTLRSAKKQRSDSGSSSMTSIEGGEPSNGNVPEAPPIQNNNINFPSSIVNNNIHITIER